MSQTRNEDGIRITTLPVEFEETMTKQAFKDETDVNKIIAKHARMGTLSHLEQWGGQYGDLADFDFQEAHNQIAKAASMFEELPSSVRDKFHNSPEAFFNFVNDPANADNLEEVLPELAETRTKPLPTPKDVKDPQTAPETEPEPSDDA